MLRRVSHKERKMKTLNDFKMTKGILSIYKKIIRNEKPKARCISRNVIDSNTKPVSDKCFIF